MDASGLGEVLPVVEAARARGESGVVVTVVANRSNLSVPAGARLYVSEGGEVVGRLHPYLDARLVADALGELNGSRSRLRSYRIAEKEAASVGIQGGDLDVFFDVLTRPPRLVIVGAGHIAVPLARVAKLLEYEVIVLDDRPEYASAERFPEADQILVGPYRQTLSGVPINADTYIVLVTRGHVHDQACLEQVLDSPAPYIGMIGSKRRVRTVLEHVRDTGRDLSGLERVYAPIGLDLGAQTPAEIALAIAAELVSVRRGGRAASAALTVKLRV